nr:immunoglobulin heavy chain junction region [Macaca mulatta]
CATIPYYSVDYW